MPYGDVEAALKGVSFTTPTPFSTDREQVLYDEIDEYVRYLEEAGASSLIPCGNTGEYYSLTNTERAEIVRKTADASGPDTTVIGGAGGSLKTVKKLSQGYESSGADALMVMTPSHTYLHQRGVIEYYREIANATELGVILYKRGDVISLPVISKLAKIDNIVGLKFAVNDIELFSKTVRAVSEDLILTTGIAERFAPSFAFEGAEGFTTGIGSFVPEASLRLMEAIRRNDWGEVRQLRDRLRPFEELRAETGPDNPFTAANNVPAIKHGMELAGFYGGPVRAPLVGLSDEDEQRATEYYEAIRDEL